MANWKKLAQGAAGAAGAGEALNVEDVFSTYLYKGTGSSLGISNGIALADGVGGGTSTEFDGSSDYLLRTTDFSNTQGSKTFTLSFWVYDNIGKAGTSRTIYYIFDGSTYYSFQVYFLSSDGYLRITGRNSSGTVILDQKITTVVRKKDQWLHVLMSFDLSDSSKRHYAVNDVVGTPSNTTYTNDTIAFSNGSPQHSIAGSFTGGTLHDGNLAHFYMDYTYRDLTVASNRRLFIDANGGSTSPSTLSALNPVIYLPMTDGYSVGENIGTGGDLTAYGSPTVVDSGTEYLSGFGQGGMVWIKSRNYTYNNNLFDSERGTASARYVLESNSTSAEGTGTFNVTTFNPDGFSLGAGDQVNTYQGYDYTSWTFRKAPKFFDVVTYTGDGTAGRTVSHNLGSTPGCIIIKGTSSNYEWSVYHRGMDSTAPEDYFMWLNHTYARFDNTGYWNDTAPTSTQFTLGNNGNVNASGQTYVAYLFAHNDGDGDFGPTGDQDIIKCGSYTGNAHTGQYINIGFEPQWLMIKRTNQSGANWVILDTMRGLPHGDNAQTLYPNLSNAETKQSNIEVSPTATGFWLDDDAPETNEGSDTYIYVAIRRGPMAVPTAATDVFAMDFLGATSPNPPAYNSSGWPVDMGIQASVGAVNSNVNSARLIQGKFLKTDSTDAETTNSQYAFDFQDGWRDSTAVSNDYLGYMWRRAPNYFDVVAYEGIGGFNGNQQNHNLGVTPEMIWIKNRDVAKDWIVYHKDLTDYEYYLKLNSSVAQADGSVTMFYAAPTATTFNVGSNGAVNGFGESFIAYLFASLDGVSKVGSYTGNGGTSVTGTGQNIDCGFSNGARFVLIKPTNAADNWFLYDSERGIVAGNDATLQLNLTAAQSTSSDEIDPLNSGFTILNGNNQLNRTGRQYIFYAIA